jgi:hypothetical protein
MLKAFGPTAARRSASYLYRNMIYEHLRVVAKRVRSTREKAVLLPSVILCMLTKYRWVLQGLRWESDVEPTVTELQAATVLLDTLFKIAAVKWVWKREKIGSSSIHHAGLAASS